MRMFVIIFAESRNWYGIPAGKPSELLCCTSRTYLAYLAAELSSNSRAPHLPGSNHRADRHAHHRIKVANRNIILIRTRTSVLVLRPRVLAGLAAGPSVMPLPRGRLYCSAASVPLGCPSGSHPSVPLSILFYILLSSSSCNLRLSGDEMMGYADDGWMPLTMPENLYLAVPLSCFPPKFLYKSHALQCSHHYSLRPRVYSSCAVV